MNDIRQSDFTIFAHVYYPDIWKDILVDLDGVIQQPFNLVITRPVGSRPVARPTSSYLRFATELEVENRGRDILPFFKALKQPLPSFDVGLKLHTKRSPHRGDGDGWRRFLIGSLLQVESSGRLSGHKLLELEPSIGLIAPRAHLLPLGGRTSINEEVIVKTLRRIEQPTEKRDAVIRPQFRENEEIDHPYAWQKSGDAESALPLTDGRFPAGSMFWFRRVALRKLVEIDFDDLFVRESGQLDGTAAHAFERLFALIVEREGLIAASMENVEPILSRGGAQLSRRELNELIGETLARDNPFALPLADLWRRYPALLKCAHAIYAKLPKSTVRMLRRSIGR
ncbi:hypothetical protein ATY81_21875 [Rhizobium sp. R72]|uniref:rhamnan synthesis F family protein n=1 Tax=unclassified Rhizobium TaxID=2613769 RepID=UPI000B538232|nr:MULTISPECIES: rhamnan synthesis F family protein [unclassified Rhizobium]OWW02305.1 hypothetical protein ATY81_21875 [Rhizobium sp. R72]OWW02439.1 hypothetical protein ATY80_21875 [Rhizobium sp. R711]